MADALLKEDGGFLLQETGDKILLEPLVVKTVTSSLCLQDNDTVSLCLQDNDTVSLCM